MDTSQVMRISAMAFLTQFCFLLGYPASWRTYHPLFLPGPQFCPDIGRTVCTAVDYYPTDQIYHLLMSSRSQVFNLTSLFVDERKGDVEPNISQLPTPQPHYQDGYGGNQHPPGGRFSPAGYNNWNNPTSDKPPAYTGLQPDRWRQVGQTQNMNGPGASRSTYLPGSGRQSRAQGMSNQRRDMNLGKNPLVTQRFNFNDRSKQDNRANGEDNFGPYEYRGVTQHNRIEPQQNIPFGNPQQFGAGNTTRYFPQDVQPQDPYQIQPPQTQYSVKGQNPNTGITMRPHTINNWKGSPTYSDKSVALQGNLQNPGYSGGRRERRNEDVEVACQVRSTYVPPRAALSDNSEWKYIVNVPERDRRFTQVVRVDICLIQKFHSGSRMYGLRSRDREFLFPDLRDSNMDSGTQETPVHPVSPYLSDSKAVADKST